MTCCKGDRKWQTTLLVAQATQQSATCKKGAMDVEHIFTFVCTPTGLSYEQMKVLSVKHTIRQSFLSTDITPN
jgi:hypothetical protein